MNWTLTPAQQRARIFLETDPEAPGPLSKPRYSDIELLAFIAERYRKLKRPPKLAELNPHRYAAQARFKGFDRALRLAAEQLLTPEEREEYVWRCEYCGRTGFRSARGFWSHVQACKRKGGNGR